MFIIDIKLGLTMENGEAKIQAFEGHRSKLVRLFGLTEEISAEDFFRSLEALSPYDKGVFFLKALDEGYWSSMRRLAEDLHTWHDLKGFSNLIGLARLPRQVLDAFDKKTSIQMHWSKKLRFALERHPELILFKAKQIQELRGSGQKWPAARVYKALSDPDSALTDQVA